jgi:hypothetical protein
LRAEFPGCREADERGVPGSVRIRDHPDGGAPRPGEAYWRKEVTMTTLPHEGSPAREERPELSLRPVLAEVAASIAIGVMWLAVLFDALFGPDIVTSSGGGTDTSTVPSAVAVALFAFLATWVLGRYAFRKR